MSRREDFRLVAGEGRYTADWNLPGELHAVFLRADRAHAEIVRLDAAARSRIPACKAVLTGDDAREAGFKSLPNVVSYPGQERAADGEAALSRCSRWAACATSASRSR